MSSVMKSYPSQRSRCFIVRQLVPTELTTVVASLNNIAFKVVFSVE